MGDGSWDKFMKRVKDDVTPPAARPRPTTGKNPRPSAPEERAADAPRKTESRTVKRPPGERREGERREGERREGERREGERPSPEGREGERRPTGKTSRPRSTEGAERPSQGRPAEGRPREARPSDSRPVRRPEGERRSPDAAPRKPDTRSVERPRRPESKGLRRPEAPAGERAESGDVRQEIKAQAKVVPLEKLRKGGTQFVRVIDPRAIEQIVGNSVRRALSQHTQRLTSEERAAIEREATSGFSELLAEHKKLQAEKSQLEAEKSAAEAQREQLAAQVDVLKADLNVEHGRLAEERRRQAERVEGIQFSAQALDELERRVHALLRRMLESGELTPPGWMAPPDGIPLFEKELAETVRRFMEAERKTRLQVAGDQHSDAVELLERRIAKLTKALEETEQQLLAPPPVEERPASVYHEVQGISEESLGFKWRSALLRGVFLQNLELRGLPITDADRHGPFPGRRLLDSLAREAAERQQARAAAGF